MVEFFHKNASSSGCSSKNNIIHVLYPFTFGLQCTIIIVDHFIALSESVASALEYLDNNATQQTRLFIRMIDKFFDCLNTKGPQMAKAQG